MGKRRAKSSTLSVRRTHAQPQWAEGLIRRAGLIHRRGTRGTRYLCWVDEVDFEFVPLPVVGEPTVEILFTPLLDVRILLNNVERLEL